MKSYTSLSLALCLAAGCAPDTSAGTAGSSSGAGGSGGASSAETGPTAEASSSASGVVVASSSGSDTTSAGGSDTSSGGGSGDGGATGTGGDDTTAASGGSGQGGSNPDDDEDGDTWTVEEGDCRDNNPNVHPEATEVCNFIDDNCDGAIDEGFDGDGDMFTTCNDDCDDGNAAINPDAVEVDNDVDDDCSGMADEPFTDGDGDNFTPAQGDCDDLQAEINPDALEFVGNDADDDCDGEIDEALEPCDGGSLDNNNAMDYARAIGLCNGEVELAQFNAGPAVARRILTSYGSNAAQLNQPAEGSKLIHLSSGTADTSTKDRGTAHDGSFIDGESFDACNDSPHPNPLPDPGDCGGADESLVCDKVELELRVRVPSNALSFSYQFQFFSSEYPWWRCSAFDDTFLAMLTSASVNAGTPTNISFDTAGHVVSVNNGFFDVCFDDDPNRFGGPDNICLEDPIATLAGTGYNPFGGSSNESSNGSGATNPLTTTSPVTPGELITIKFIIFDEFDDILDSSVLIDDWKWSLDPADGPSTNPT